MLHPKIIPSATNVATKLFLWKPLTRIKNSPIKLLVLGKLMSLHTLFFYCFA